MSGLGQRAFRALQWYLEDARWRFEPILRNGVVETLMDNALGRPSEHVEAAKRGIHWRMRSRMPDQRIIIPPPAPGAPPATLTIGAPGLDPGRLVTWTLKHGPGASHNAARRHTKYYFDEVFRALADYHNADPWRRINPLQSYRFSGATGKHSKIYAAAIKAAKRRGELRDFSVARRGGGFLLKRKFPLRHEVAAGGALGALAGGLGALGGGEGPIDPREPPNPFALAAYPGGDLGGLNLP